MRPLRGRRRLDLQSAEIEDEEDGYRLPYEQRLTVTTSLPNGLRESVIIKR